MCDYFDMTTVLSATLDVDIASVSLFKHVYRITPSLNDFFKFFFQSFGSIS